MSFKEIMNEIREDGKRKRKKMADKRKELDELGTPYCPRCLNTNLSTNKKGYGLGRGAVGAVVAGPIGLAAGMVGKNKVMCTCLKCGYKFKAGSKI